MTGSEDTFKPILLLVRDSSSESNTNVYGLIPNRDANLAALILFAILWGWNTVIGIYTKQWWFFTAFFIGCGLETAGYIGRYLSHGDPYNINYFLDQIVCLTLAPAFFMGGVYYLLAKFSMIYGSGVSRLKPMVYSYIFISCDLLSIILQAIGGGMAATALDENKDTDPGTHIMVAGLAVQVAAMSVFGALSFDFIWRVIKMKKKGRTEHPNLSDKELDALIFEPKYAFIRNKEPLYHIFLYAIFTCSLLIYVRCIYRLIELAEGWDGYLILHEPYFLVLEALIVFLGVLSLSIVHPGFVFGRNTSIPVKGLHKKKHFEETEEEKTLEFNESDTAI
ncbi:uncharacterized protein SAPINGB_P003271 [Magnusiomyces paraingens]|uniref:Sphingoid long-chain base transporter RSB1 n=1 Tax=Magnusiomyces paraingens TaxID=2606893 RepID=A0A5E8BL12_9ASCO|nr:uncharacterized protein SAPINGB_P003271 [Saprochaete ingens]VVT51963.1 unnamed protein product [Saprochaete ingens]